LLRSQYRNRFANLGESHGGHNPLPILVIGALGVVFGDIGTSPLYAVRECFTGHNLSVTPENILGVLSLIFWTLTVIISIKYVIFVLRADNKGEGGVLSLMALASSTILDTSTKRKWLITALGVFGASLLYGDGIITPAISVLSAVEGLNVVTPVFEPFVIPITVMMICFLFFFQRFGTGWIGLVFGPVISLWFLVIGSLGFAAILANPEVLEALNPIHAIQFFQDNGHLGFLVLGSVVLVVTGGEALYADMGHFGRKAIRIAWFSVAMPGLLLNYFGQGALLLKDPTAISNPFYLLAPSWALPSLVVLATAAAVIASQALISGIFSITKQAVQMGFLPRLSIIHTSRREIGQIYIPFINWALMGGVLWLVFAFKSSSDLAAAYGIAVTGTMVITTAIAMVVARRIWKWSWIKTICIFGSFGIVEIIFFKFNLNKVTDGGWVPLLLGAIIYLVMSTWAKGRRILAARLKARSISMVDFVERLENDPPRKVEGSAIYMTGDTWGVPVPLLHNLKHNKVMHSQIAILTIKTLEVPMVLKKERVQIEVLAPHFFRIIANYGFMEIPKIKHILEACRERGIPFPIQETTFVLGRETILPSGDPTLSLWREKLFAFMARNAERPTSFFKIPPNQVIEVGIQVEI
jgi:KUP system potassium uptake protein